MNFCVLLLFYFIIYYLLPQHTLGIGGIGVGSRRLKAEAEGLS